MTFSSTVSEPCVQSMTSTVLQLLGQIFRIPSGLVNKYFQFSSLFFIIYVPNQQLQGQLQTENSADIHMYIMDRYNI
jgi:hypothetical protein